MSCFIIQITILEATFNSGSICEHLLCLHYKTITNKKLADFIKNVRAFSKFYKNKKLVDTNFVILSIHKPSLGSLSPIGLAVFTFIGYKLVDRQAKFMNRSFFS